MVSSNAVQAHDVLVTIGSDGHPHFQREIGGILIELLYADESEGGWTVLVWELDEGDMRFLDADVFEGRFEQAVIEFTRAVQELA